MKTDQDRTAIEEFNRSLRNLLDSPYRIRAKFDTAARSKFRQQLRTLWARAELATFLSINAIDVYKIEIDLVRVGNMARECGLNVYDVVGVKRYYRCNERLNDIVACEDERSRVAVTLQQEIS